MTRFLYVEDDPMSRQVLKILLTKSMDYAEEDLVIFDNTENFMERLHALPDVPDVCFLDIHMQPHNGFEVLGMLRADPVYGRQIVIAMTAGVMASDIEQLKQAGFDGMIGKPIRKKLFPELLQRILEGESIWFTA